VAAGAAAAACDAIIGLYTSSSTAGGAGEAVDLGRVGDLCLAVQLSDLSALPGGQLSGLLAALAGLKVGLRQPLGRRTLGGKAAVSYGEVVLAAMAAAVGPRQLAGMSPEAAAELLVSVAGLGVQPSLDWTAAVCGQLLGQLGQLSSERLLGVLEAAGVVGAAPGAAWLQEASEVRGGGAPGCRAEG
jgi:hypothetical protein